MVEVFKTNVNDPRQANHLVELIHKYFTGYQANFDLWDCDNILRIKTPEEPVHSSALINFLQELGCDAMLLEDEVKWSPGS